MSTSTCSSVPFYSVKVIHSLISLNNWKRLSKFSKYRVMCTSGNPKILTQWLVHIRSYPGLHFPAFELIRRDTLNTDTSPQERQLQIRTLFTQCFRKRKTFGFVRIFDWISCFLCPACWIVHESSRSETVESLWDSHLMSQLASDLSAIIINLVLFFSLVGGDVKEEMAISGSLSLRC